MEITVTESPVNLSVENRLRVWQMLIKWQNAINSPPDEISPFDTVILVDGAGNEVNIQSPNCEISFEEN